MDTGLAGLGVLVTGGAGGIGSAIVRCFAKERARVAIHYHTSRERAEGLARDTEGVALQADLTVEVQVDRLVANAVAALGRLDILVANAGIWNREPRSIRRMSLDQWRTTIAADLDSVFLSCRAFLRHVATTGRGNIVLIGSTAAIFGEAGHGDYAAAKGAVVTGLLKTLKNEIVEIAPLGRVNALCPGWIRTELTETDLLDPTVEPRVTRTMALRKIGSPDDVARLAVALASDSISGHVTGEVISVAGGMEGRVLHELDVMERVESGCPLGASRGRDAEGGAEKRRRP